MEIYLVRFLESLLIPPGSLILLMLLGTFALRRWYRTGTLMVLAGFLGLLVASLPITAQGLLYLLEITPPINPAALEKPSAGAIVVLGAGRRYGALEL
ncbi:MAG TPA: YdcF family protein, partial [Gammaproteobacteria bacterium]|nr:YdcF family protein [Gammaproteobacteria bacterium]